MGWNGGTGRLEVQRGWRAARRASVNFPASERAGAGLEVLGSLLLYPRLARSPVLPLCPMLVGKGKMLKTSVK